MESIKKKLIVALKSCLIVSTITIIYKIITVYAIYSVSVSLGEESRIIILILIACLSIMFIIYILYKGPYIFWNRIRGRKVEETESNNTKNYGNDKYFYLKSFTLFIFVLTITGVVFIEKFHFREGTFYDIPFGILYVSYSISYLTAYILHYIIYREGLKFNGNYINSESKLKSKELIFDSTFLPFKSDKEGEVGAIKPAKFFYNFLIRFISPDYSYAINFKALISNRKHQENERKTARKNFIVVSNRTNVMLAVFYVVISIVAVNLAEDERLEGVYLAVFFYVFFRIISRIFEIIIAFYKDVVRRKIDKDRNGYKSSSLLRGERLSLAVHSLLEVIIIYSAIYFLSSNLLNFNYTIQNSDQIYYINTYINYLIYSFSVTVSNVSLTPETPTLQMLLHSSQVLTSITLLVLSIASYIGIQDKKTKE